MISGWLVGDKEIVARLEATPEKLRQGLLRAVWSLTLELEGLVKQKLSGEVLKARSGALRESVHSDVLSGTSSVTGCVGTNVPYAAAHEYGVVTSPHIILPKRGRALVFWWRGRKWVLAKVDHPGSKIPERSFLRSSLCEMESKIRDQLAQTAREAINA